MKNRFTLRLILGLFLVTGVATQAADAKFKPLFNGKNLKGWEPTPVSYTHLTLPTTPYV